MDIKLYMIMGISHEMKFNYFLKILQGRPFNTRTKGEGLGNRLIGIS